MTIDALETNEMTVKHEIALLPNRDPSGIMIFDVIREYRPDDLRNLLWCHKMEVVRVEPILALWHKDLHPIVTKL